MKIATWADRLAPTAEEGVRASRQCGAAAVQLSAAGPLDPQKPDAGAVRRVREAARDQGQDIAALWCPLGVGLAQDAPDKTQRLKAAADLAAELACPVVTANIGVLPRLRTSEAYQSMLEACREAGGYAAEKGVALGLETGPEPLVLLRGFTDLCGEGVGISYDPAALVMITADDEVRGVLTSGNALVHAYARDGVLHHYLGPAKAYEGLAAGQALDDYFADRPLEEGAVRWTPYLAALAALNYEGCLTIAPQPGDDTLAATRRAVQFLSTQLAALPPPEQEAP